MTVSGGPQEADPPGGLEHRPVDVVEGPDRLLVCLGDQLLDGQALAPQVGVQQVPVLDQDNRLGAGSPERRSPIRDRRPIIPADDRASAS